MERAGRLEFYWNIIFVTSTGNTYITGGEGKVTSRGLDTGNLQRFLLDCWELSDSRTLTL